MDHFHEGHETAKFVVEDKTDSQQREATLAVMKGDTGGSWDIPFKVTEIQLEPIFTPYQVTLNGPARRAHRQSLRGRIETR